MKPNRAPALTAAEIMREFAEATGLDPIAATPRRYLWTDAFAVCNFLELFRQTQDQAWRDLALRLVHQVHHTLGRHRDDDPRTGWISGLGEDDGELHPTRGGLRIGKTHRERGPEQPHDEQLEWDRDGQYYHYLVKWLHALHQVNRVTGDTTYLRWALELAQTAHERFSYLPARGGARRLYWKMSIDLRRPLVPSMGEHDPLDGLVACSELQAAAAGASGVPPLPSLQAVLADLAEMCRGREWATDDPLGIGGLLCDASFMAQLMRGRAFGDPVLLEKVLDSALLGLEFVGTAFQHRAAQRLAFRELGLAIGLKAARHMRDLVSDDAAFLDPRALTVRVAALTEYLPLAETIEEFWLDQVNRSARGWTEHRDINMAMLATSLAPNGFIVL